MDKWLAAFAALIFLLCSLLLLDDLRIIQLPFSVFGERSVRSPDEKPIATLIRQDNDVRRRSQDDIAWQSLSQGTPLYANDSVLTLSGSGAWVQVGRAGRIELGENTLIVLEKSKSDASGEIRLRFKKGRISSHESKGAVTSGEWDLSFREDAKFEIRAIGDENFEVDVQSGSLEVQDQSGQRQTVTSKSVRLEETGIIDLKKDTSLSFKDGAFRRVYSHSLEPILIEWNGDADELRLEGQTTSRKTQGQNSMRLNLDNGTHVMRLHSKNGESEVLRLEIRKAPILHLYAPLPRERVIRGTEFRFEWRRHAGSARSYVELSETPDFKTLTSRLGPATDHAVHKFNQTGRYFWRVVGEDLEGAKIPALYHNEIFSVDAPLEAPSVQDPGEESTHRYPSGASIRGLLPKILWLLLHGQMAQANDKTFVFEWNRVKGAEKYVLEIDDDPYFQSPEVITEPSENLYRWKPTRLGVYHWRVAADSKGRMGLFSPVQKVDLRKLQSGRGPYTVRADSNRKPAQSENLPIPTTEPKFLEKVESPNPPPVPKEVLVFPPQEPPAEEAKAESPTLAPFRTGYLWYAPQYVDRRTGSKEIDELKLSGLELINFGGHLAIHPGSWYGRLHFRYSQTRYLVKDKKTHPFQEPVDLREYELGYSVVLPKSPVEVGVLVAERPQTQKTGLESFRLNPTNFYGPRIGYTQSKETWGWQASAGFLFGPNSFVVPVQTLLWSSPTGLQGATFGFQAEFELQRGDSNWQNIRLMIPVGYSY